jgi:hypothetical protein
MAHRSSHSPLRSYGRLLAVILRPIQICTQYVSLIELLIALTHGDGKKSLVKLSQMPGAQPWYLSGCVPISFSGILMRRQASK